MTAYDDRLENSFKKNIAQRNRDISKTTWNFDKRSKLVNLSDYTL